MPSGDMALMDFKTCSLDALTVWVAPKRLSKFNLLFSMSTAMIVEHPRFLAPNTTPKPTPPTPKIAMDDFFAASKVLLIMPQPVTTAQPTIAATSAGVDLVIFVILFSE